MRPVRLELTGFSAYREQTVVDFGDADLHVFVGPTGAGKSSIIDGIVFALYGSVPRYDKANVVAPVINQLSTETRVRLDFTVDEVRFAAVRVVRRTSKGASTKEARLIREIDTDAETVVAGTTTELDDAIVDLLGLTFDQFTKTAILPQGAFARFLVDPPAERQTLLRRLLGMERFTAMASSARQRASIAETKASTLADQLDALDVPSDDDRAAAIERRDRLAESVSALAVDAPRIRDALDTAGREMAALNDAAAITTELEALGVPDDVADVAERLDALAEAATAAAHAHEIARTDDAQASAALVDPTHVQAWSRSSQLIEEIDQGRTALANRQSETTELAKRHTRAADAAAEAVEARDRAKADLEHRRVHAGAAALRPALIVGDACPVCEQTVATAPQSSLDLDDLSAAEAALAAADDAVTTTATTAARAMADVDANTALVERLAADIAETNDQLTSLLNAASIADPDAGLPAEVPDPLAKTVRKAIAARLDTALHAQETASAAANALRDAMASVDEIARRRLALTEESAVASDLAASIRKRFASLDPPAVADQSLSNDLAALVAWAHETAVERRTVHTERFDALQSTTSSLLAELEVHRATARELDVETTADAGPDDLRTAFASALATIDAQLAALADRVELAAALRAEIDELTETASVASELGRLLGARGFEQWLMSDIVHDLAARASEHLSDLARGGWSIAVDGAEFAVIDHRNADERRSARTLSGGETFLTSLALALALADAVAELSVEGAPKLESMFLDEGFGTLDPETLDVVATAIEELGARGRMIGIVTHIAELADRIPVRFVVSNSSGSASVVRAEEDRVST